MPRLNFRSLLVALGLAVLAGPVRAEMGWWQRLGVRDLTGGPVAADGRWIVVVFLSPECPVANASVPILNALANEFGPHGFAFVGAYADPMIGLPAMRQHAREYGLTFASADDRTHALVRLTGATWTPEVFVYAADGRRLYHGRIDDRVGDFGAARPTAVQQDLREVLAALAAGQPGPFPDRRGFGCSIPEVVKP